MFERLLIANRGEIACRVIRSAQALGIHTVAVYSTVDRDALHVALADSAVEIGGAAPQSSYLDIARIVAAAQATGAQAVHPGYGFLAENADFARACAAAGVVFVGPSADAIAAMGDKARAKQLMAAANVPVVPGYDGADQSLEALVGAANAIGFPLLAKPVAGGGGKGMRLIRQADDLVQQLQSARREAVKAFGDDRLILERYLTRPRHVEVQILADNRGHCIHLGERDCSVQRRYQKVFEEAPAPDLNAGLREAIHRAAIAAAQAIDYRGAGTVEFLVVGEEFFFMEMNTRLQVEHPVTEMITGIDLVLWQLLIAAGENLDIRQAEVRFEGHAIEARLYAEDPKAEHLPSTGVLRHLRLPEQGNAVRIDTGIRQADEITVFYDPLIAKVIGWGADRQQALSVLAKALNECEVIGVTTNLAVLLQVVTDPAFRAGAVTTDFLDQREFPLASQAGRAVLPIAAVAACGMPAVAAALSWQSGDGWRLNRAGRSLLDLEGEDGGNVVEIEFVGNAATVYADDQRWRVTEISRCGNRINGDLDGEPFDCPVIFDDETVWIWVDAAARSYRRPRQRDLAAAQEGALVSPMPGQVLDVLVAEGDAVEVGQTLMIVEAMKMEHPIRAPRAGVVEAVFFRPGQQVREGQQLARLV